MESHQRGFSVGALSTSVRSPLEIGTEAATAPSSAGTFRFEVHIGVVARTEITNCRRRTTLFLLLPHRVARQSVRIHEVRRPDDVHWLWFRAPCQRYQHDCGENHRTPRRKGSPCDRGDRRGWIRRWYWCRDSGGGGHRNRLLQREGRLDSNLTDLKASLSGFLSRGGLALPWILSTDPRFRFVCSSK